MKCEKEKQTNKQTNKYIYIYKEKEKGTEHQICK